MGEVLIESLMHRAGKLHMFTSIPKQGSQECSAKMSPEGLPAVSVGTIAVVNQEGLIQRLMVGFYSIIDDHICL